MLYQKAVIVWYCTLLKYVLDKGMYWPYIHKDFVKVCKLW